MRKADVPYCIKTSNVKYIMFNIIIHCLRLLKISTCNTLTTNGFFFCFRADNNMVPYNDKLLSTNTLVEVNNYQLTLTKQMDCDVDQVTNLVQQYVSEYALIFSTKSQIIYYLPARQRNQFSSLCSVLEHQKQYLKLLNIEITNITTEKIYTK